MDLVKNTIIILLFSDDKQMVEAEYKEIIISLTVRNENRTNGGYRSNCFLFSTFYFNPYFNFTGKHYPTWLSRFS